MLQCQESIELLCLLTTHPSEWTSLCCPAPPRPETSCLKPDQFTLRPRPRSRPASIKRSGLRQTASVHSSAKRIKVSGDETGAGMSVGSERSLLAFGGKHSDERRTTRVLLRKDSIVPRARCSAPIVRDLVGVSQRVTALIGGFEYSGASAVFVLS